MVDPECTREVPAIISSYREKPPVPEPGEIGGPEEAFALGDEYVECLGKIINSHVRNERAGAAAFDEPSIAHAPTAKDKWLACRMAMEEYGHHLQFNKLAAALSLEDPYTRPPLTVFEEELSSWPEYVLSKALIDLAEIVLMEDLCSCSYRPLRDLCVSLMPEERFHVRFGRDGSRRLARDPARRGEMQRVVDGMVPVTMTFFGRSDSPNNARFRRWGIKRLTNDECRRIFSERARSIVEDDLNLVFPEVKQTWNGSMN
ncbi:hypothetical protein SUDANB67_00182 [Nocardiopsis dassonvillei]|uniref:Phenylacetic acid catabolic protein n=1 Tax=Nocardiopsis sp. LDBS0036 TaxID=3104276 RepID=UPI0035148B40